MLVFWVPKPRMVLQMGFLGGISLAAEGERLSARSNLRRGLLILTSP